MQLVKYLAITERVLNLLCVLLATNWVPGCPLATASPVVHGAGLNTAHLQIAVGAAAQPTCRCCCRFGEARDLLF